MKRQSLKTKIFFSFFLMSFTFAALVFLAGVRIIKHDVIARAQKQIKNDLRVASSVFNGEIEAIQKGFNLISSEEDLAQVKVKMGLDYLYKVERNDKDAVKSEIVRTAFRGQPIGGIRIIGTDELRAMGPDVVRRYSVDLRPTPQALPPREKILQEAMAIGYAMPVTDSQHNVESVIYGGKIINKDFALVDKIRDLVFEDKVYDKKPVGTVTIFLHNIRVATNVLDREGSRAIGTAVSETVANKVLREGRSWLDRAFVVTDWYLTAYEPLKNINGDIIGILYVGVLEKPFRDLEKKILLLFMGIISLVVVLAVFLSYFLAHAIADPVRDMLVATEVVSCGDLNHRIETKSDIRELNKLAAAFNAMTLKLRQREEMLFQLNKSYLDLIGFVAHELKGILSSTILNAYSVRDGFLGLVNFKQRKALDSVTRNLDHLEATVRNFLNLSRIEKGEMRLNDRDVLVREEVFDPAIENFSKLASEKNMEIVNSLEPGLKIRGDADLLQIVANNLISNAIKYGNEGGRITVSPRRSGGKLEIEIYNDGKKIVLSELEKLFKRFSRLEPVAGLKAQGTGLGLFITKEIIEKHGGRIWVEPKDNGNAFIIQIASGA